MSSIPFPFIPMEPVPYDKGFDSQDYVYQLKWDGVRCLAYAMDGAVELYNRRLHRRSEQYPEVIDALSYLPQGTVLDGEIVALNESGLPDFPRVLKRDLLKSKPSIRTAMARVPIAYVVFDLPYYAGECLCERPLSERLERLNDAVAGVPPLLPIDTVAQGGAALFTAVKDMGMEGIVAKRRTGRYLIARKSESWLKIKAWRDLEASILGYVEEAGRVRSLVLGLRQDGQWRYIGNASSGLNENMRSALKRLKAAGGAPAGIRATQLPGVRYVEPDHLAKLRYLEWSEGGRLRSPSIISIFESGAKP